MLDLEVSSRASDMTCPNAHRGHLTEGAGQGDRLKGGLERHPFLVLDEDEDLAHISPSSSNRSATAGAASGPWPRIVVELATSGGLTRRSMRRPPGV